MNLKQMILCTAIAAFLATDAATALANDVLGQDLVPLSISGTVSYTTNLSTNMGAPLMTYSFNNAALIKLLNASTNATNTIQTVTGSNQIPSGSSIRWNPFESILIITNKSGFSFPLSGSNYNYGVLVPTSRIGTYRLHTNTLAGTEKDIMQFVFSFNDGGVNDMITLGKATLNWTYGPVKTNFQAATLSVTMSGNNAYESGFAGYRGLTTSFSASGTGSWVEPSILIPFFFEPR